MALVKVDDANDLGPILKWSETLVGFTLDGTITAGPRPGKFGPLYDLQLDDGTAITIPAPYVLERRLAKRKIGDWVRIVYLGMVNPPGGRQPYHNFEVYIDDGQAPEPTPAPTPPASRPRR